MLISHFLVIIALISSVMLIPPAFAQSSPPTGDGIEITDIVEPINLGVIAAAFVIGGIGWSILGWQKRRRESKAPIDYKKLGKTVIVGVIVGIISLIYLIYTDSSIENLYVTSIHGFAALVTWAFSIIVTTVVVLKKLFPDLFRNTTKENNIFAELDEELDEKEELPPGNEEEEEGRGEEKE